MQRKLYKTSVFRGIANFEERANLRDGDTVNRPYRSDIVVHDYTKGTAITAQDISATNEQLSIDKIKAALIYIDNVDKIQNKYSAVNEWSAEAAIRLSNIIDADFFATAPSCDDSIDDGDIGGTAGNPVTVSASNILNVFGKTNKKLDTANVPREGRYFAISPQMFDVLWQYIAGKESILGDKTGLNGNVGKWAGFDLFMTNNLTASAVWTPADNPANTATIVIEGITFTFVSTISTVAGNILQTSDTETTLEALADLINAGGVTSDAGVSNVSLSTANQRKVQQWVATVTATAITVYVKGGSYVTVTTSEAADVWSAETQHSMAGQKKTIDLVIQKEPGIEMGNTVSAGKIGINVIPWTLYGVKMFVEGTLRNLDVQVDSSSY